MIKHVLILDNVHPYFRPSGESLFEKRVKITPLPRDTYPSPSFAMWVALVRVWASFFLSRN